MRGIHVEFNKPKFTEGFKFRLKFIVFIFIMVLGIIVLRLNGHKAQHDLSSREGIFGSTKYIDRHITIVDSFTGRTVWERDGEMYIYDRSNGSATNITISWKDDNGIVQKVDIIGVGYSVFSETH
jgi:hypothetical protein